MARTVADARQWMSEGTALVLDAMSALSEQALAGESLLPGWTRKHVVAHVAANADAVGNLVHWARTGVETPMYKSPGERAAGIERGAALPVPELRAWLHGSAERLAAAMDRLTTEEWAREVVTAQGRTVPAGETPWLRAREVCMHAVDLRCGISFTALPDAFTRELRAEALARHGLVDLPAEVAGAPLCEITAWLTGRPHTVTGAPQLGPWL